MPATSRWHQLCPSRSGGYVEKLACGELSFFNLAERFGAPRPLRRCLSLMRQHAADFVYVEELLPDEVTAREAERFAAKNYVLNRTRHRLTFSKLRDGAEYCLGYCIVHDDDISYRTDGAEGNPFDRRCYVASAVIEPPAKEDRFVTCAREFGVEFNGGEPTVEGVYFCQQPKHTGCCAHASLTAVAQLMGVAGDAFCNLNINEIVGLDVFDCPGPSDGLDSDQIKLVLEDLGLTVSRFQYIEPDDDDADGIEQYRQLMEMFPPQQAMYLAVESGFPVLFAFQLGEGKNCGHVVAVVGHELNRDTWLAEARYDYVQLADDPTIKFLRSASWTSHFVALDDNYGPYCSLPNDAWRDGFQEVLVVTRDGCNFELAFAAEPTAAAALRDVYAALVPLLGAPGNSVWARRLFKKVAENHTIMRTTWSSKNRYLEQTESRAREAGAQDTWDEARKGLEVVLPEYFWLVEVSIPELYPTNGGKLADIILVENAANELEMVAARVPEFVLTANGPSFALVGLPEMDRWYKLLDR